MTKILIETDTCVGKCSTFCEDSTDQIRSALQGRLYMIVRSCNDSINDASSVSNKAKQGSVTMIPNSTIDVIQSYLKKLK